MFSKKTMTATGIVLMLVLSGPALATLPAIGSSVSLHLEADGLGLANGADVSSWATSTGPANAATVESAGVTPTYTTGWSPSGLPGVTFDGVDDRMVLDSAVGAETIFVVMKMNGTGFPEQQQILGAASGKVMGVRNGALFVKDEPGWQTAFSDTESLHVITWVRNEELYIDGVGTGSNPLNEALLDIVLIGDERQTPPDNPGPNMTFGEFVLYQSAVTPADRLTIESYLNTKWVVIPEPATLGLFGAAVLLALKRRR